MRATRRSAKRAEARLGPSHHHVEEVLQAQARAEEAVVRRGDVVALVEAIVFAHGVADDELDAQIFRDRIEGVACRLQVLLEVVRLVEAARVVQRGADAGITEVELSVAAEARRLAAGLQIAHAVERSVADLLAVSAVQGELHEPEAEHGATAEALPIQSAAVRTFDELPRARRIRTFRWAAGA